MDGLMKWALPGGMGILLLFVAAITTTWDRRVRIATNSNTTQVGNLVGEWVIFGLLVVVVLLIFGAVRGAAGR
jgi:hypothetical protein